MKIKQNTSEQPMSKGKSKKLEKNLKQIKMNTHTKSMR